MELPVAQAADFARESGDAPATLLHPDGSTIGLRFARVTELETIRELWLREIGKDVASLEVMQRVYQYDPASFSVLLRAEAGSESFVIVGCYCALYLNREGAAHLNAGAFDARDPDLDNLASPSERPSLIYIWAMVARKLVTVTAPLFVKLFPGERYGGVPLAARAGTQGGLKSAKASATSDEHASAIGDVFHLDSARTPVGAHLRSLAAST